MAQLKYKMLYANGDSWTAGDIVDPILFGDQVEHSMHPDNDNYRLPRVWPHKLGKLFNIEVENASYAGSSNDGIVKRTLNDIPRLLSVYDPKDILVIIGWSSPERKDFYYKSKKQNSWDTLYPGELDHWNSEEVSKNEFYKIYVTRYWNFEEFITRYIHQNILLSSYLSNLGITHKFFNAFYENEDCIKSKDKHQLLDSPDLHSYITYNFEINKNFNSKYLDIDYAYKEYCKVYNKYFFKQSFIQELKKHKISEVMDYHPFEIGHDIWANFLYNNL